MVFREAFEHPWIRMPFLTTKCMGTDTVSRPTARMYMVPLQDTCDRSLGVSAVAKNRQRLDRDSLGEIRRSISTPEEMLDWRYGSLRDNIMGDMKLLCANCHCIVSL